MLVVVFAARLAIYRFGYVRGQVGGAHVSHDLRIALGDAMRGGEELELLGPRRVEELVSLALRLQFDLVLELLAGCKIYKK